MFFIKKDQSFPLFPKLPLELRRLIWRHSLPGPRMICTYCWAPLCASGCAMPIALHVNREARGVALELYKARFGLLSAPERPPKSISTRRSIQSIWESATLAHLVLILLYLFCAYSNLLRRKWTLFFKGGKRGGPRVSCVEINEEEALPCQLTKRAIWWEGELSELWAYVEKNEFNDSTPINTVRLVSWGALGRERWWAARINFLKAHAYVPITGCLYEDDGLVMRLVELEGDEDPKYDELADIINVGLGRPERLDPLEVYVSSNECDCFVGHRLWISPPYWVPDISKIGLRGALAFVDGDDSAWPESLVSMALLSTRIVL